MSMLFNGLSGIVASQIALDTVSQNLANSLTPNYTRQGVALSAKASTSIGNAAGNGVEATSLIRYADSYKTQQMWRANSNLGQYEAAQTYLLQMEQVMGDASSGLSASLDNFFAALSAASVEPASSPLRQQIIEEAKALGQSVGNLAQIISNQKDAIVQQRDVAVDELNSYVQQIAALNTQIIQAHGAGLNTSALQDQRDARVDDLSKLVGLQTMTQPDGSISLSLRGGQPLVVGDRFATMDVASINGGYVMQVAFGNERFSLGAGGWQGTLGGLSMLETDMLIPLESSVRDMAKAIADEFNNILTQGYGVNPAVINAGPPVEYEKAPALFQYDPNSSASMLTVAKKNVPVDVNDPNAGTMEVELTSADLGLSSRGDEAGNSIQLQQLIALQQKPVQIALLGNQVLLGDVYTQIVGKLGTYSQQSQAAYGTSKTVRDQSESNWRSTSAVNTDEEAVNLMQYQQMYQANMKVISTANALFDSLLQLR